jgi:hypothetical protein
MKFLLIAIPLFMLPAAPVVAQDTDPDTYMLVEPTTAENGGPLVALDECRVTFTPEFAAYPPKTTTFQASSNSGGGTHTFRVTDTIPFVQGNVSLSATCSNSAGESGAALAASNFPISAPSAPALSE